MKAVVWILLGALAGALLTFGFTTDRTSGACTEAMTQADESFTIMAQALALSGNLTMDGIKATTTALDKDYDGVTRILDGMKVPSDNLELLAHDIQSRSGLLQEQFAACRG